MKRVLFVCVENACRSQMAEGFFNTLARGRAFARSAGSNLADRINPLALQVMSEVGIDISKCKPKMITAEMIRESDRVVLMGCGENACPIVPKEVEDWHIEDPDGKGIEKFREIRDILKRKVGELMVELGVEPS